jgi:hypothetical protein
MKTFTVEGYNWREDYEVDDSLFDNYEDMAFEAMTLALKQYMTFPTEAPVWHSSCQPIINKLPEWGDAYEREEGELIELTWTTMAWEKGYENDPGKKIAALTDFVLRNAGHHELADEIRGKWLKVGRNGK